MTVRVEPYTLDWKARAIAEPMPAMPEPPVAADGTQIATDGLEQLTSGASKLKGYLESGEREAKRLSESFTAAAEAYRQVDVETCHRTGERRDCSQDLPGHAQAHPVGFTAGSERLRRAQQRPRRDIRERRTGSPATRATRPGRVACALRRQPEVVLARPDRPRRQFQGFGPALERASRRQRHGGVGQAPFMVAPNGRHDTRFGRPRAGPRRCAQHCQEQSPHHRTNQAADAEMQAYGFNPEAMAAYQALQAKSDEVQTAYANGAKMPVCHPPKPPSGSPSMPPVTENGDPRDSDIHKMEDPGQKGPGSNPPGGNPPDSGTPESPQTPTTAPTSPASAEQPKSGGQPASGGSPSGGSPSGGSPSGGSGSGGGMPSLPGGDPSKDMPGLPDGPDLSPAAAGSGGGGSGGGGAGGGGGGMPLQPAASGPAIGTSPTGGGAGGGHPAAASAGGGMAGGMGGGGMPMGGHGQGGGAKEKRRTPGLTPDEVIYTEDREWTENYIGQQAKRRTSADSKDAK